MCDYWISTDVDVDETRGTVKDVLAQLRTAQPVDLLIETSGSFFDDREVNPELRTWMLQQFRGLALRYAIVETRTDMLDDESLDACVSVLRPSKLVVEFGVESLDPWVLMQCINKDTRPGSVEQAVEQVHRSDALATANVLVGAPFLSLSEQIADSRNTLQGVLDMGYDSAVLFPVNVKHYTLTGWLHDRGMYEPPSLWALVDVLYGIRSELLPRIVISWHRPRPDYHPGYTTSYLGPETCPNCYSQVAALLDGWRQSADRAELLAELYGIACGCRDDHEARKHSTDQPLVERLKAQQRRIVDELLDGSWGIEYLDAIPDHRFAGA